MLTQKPLKVLGIYEMIKYNPKKHEVFDFLTFEYGGFDADDFREDMQLSNEGVSNLKRGLQMEMRKWGFLEYKNCVLFRGKQNNLKERTYFIVSPDKEIFSTLELENLKNLKFGDSDSILKLNALDYWGICKYFLDETSFERAGSF